MSRFATRVGPGLVDWSENLPDHGRFRGTQRAALVDTQLWKINDDKANKDGARRMMYWVDTKPKKEDGTMEKEPYYIKETYQGQWKNNKKHDYGVQTYKNGDRYEGQWLNGMRHGEGVLWVKVPGTKSKFRREYTGGWSEDKQSGAGTCYYPNTDRYEGQWLNGKRHGQGCLRSNNGDVYEGAWSEDTRHGYGALTYANGDVYQGSWHNDEKEGFGALYFFQTGRVLVGEWAKGSMRTGIYSKAEPAPGEAKPTGKMEVLQRRLVKIQKLELADPVGVLRDALHTVRLDRFYRLYKDEAEKWEEAQKKLLNQLQDNGGDLGEYQGDYFEGEEGLEYVLDQDGNPVPLSNAHVDADAQLLGEGGAAFYQPRMNSRGVGGDELDMAVMRQDEARFASPSQRAPPAANHQGQQAGSSFYSPSPARSPPVSGMAAQGMRLMGGNYDSPLRRA